MIALVIAFLGFGLLGLAAYALVIAAAGLIIARLYWRYRFVRFIIRLAVVLAHAAFFIAVDVFRSVRFTILARRPGRGRPRRPCRADRLELANENGAEPSQFDPA